MNPDELTRWRHTHSFGQDERRPGEDRTRIVIALTASMMVVEIAAGVAFGSMALLADGLHMASHAAALTINAFAYAFARRRAHDPEFSFGTGKVNALGGFAGAVLLAVFALMMAWESVLRIVRPVGIAFDQAILVAAVGLLVNGASALVLSHRGGDHEETRETDLPHEHDHNLRAAYLHVLADALTSVLAILALLAGKYAGLAWMDPVVGIAGAVVVSRWSLGLLRDTSRILLDRQAPESIREAIRRSIEDEDNRIADLHVWSIGPRIYGAIISVVDRNPRPPEHYKARIPGHLGVVHVTVEVHAFAPEEARSD